MTDKELLKILVEKRPVTCNECGGKMSYTGIGEYKCMECGSIQLDDFGKVRNFLYENGPSPAPVVMAATGVSGHIVTELLKTGRIEVIENSKVFINCEKCGCAIKFGRICPDCAKSDMNRIQDEVEGIIGEKPKNKENIKKDRKHGMHYFHRDSFF